MIFNSTFTLALIALFFSGLAAAADEWKADLEPLVRSVDLSIGQTATVTLCDDSTATVELLDVDVDRDSLRDAVRAARVRVKVNGVEATLPAALYNLPREVGGVQIDCAIVKPYLANAKGNPWALEADARLRLWPAGSPWARPGTFAYPLKQRWFASASQVSNEPTYVDGVESPAWTTVYYHFDLDFGGVEGAVEVVAATDGLVVTAGGRTLDDTREAPYKPRHDRVQVLDRRGWHHVYYHLVSIDPTIQPGVRVKMGEPIGIVGKEVDSGGWSHLHYGITSRQTGGQWGTEDAYAFIWQAYLAEHKPKIIAVARPHHLLAPGETITLDARKSWCAAGKMASYEWTFTDGTTTTGPTVKRRYDTPGEYSEILRVTDAAGNVEVDFAIVQVVPRSGDVPLALHLNHNPTLGITPGDPVTFTVRAFGTTHGRETIDFGDGTEPVHLESDGNVNALAPHGYAVTTHRFAKPGRYIVTARRTDARGMNATARVYVVVEAK
jgi:murein DD-endopeptidase MepM/ murein hydrolase activator NlpD